MADQENAAALFLGQQGFESLEMVLAFLCNVVTLADPSGVRTVKVVETDDGGLGNDFNEISDFQVAAS